MVLQTLSEALGTSSEEGGYHPCFCGVHNPVDVGRQPNTHTTVVKALGRVPVGCGDHCHGYVMPSPVALFT